MNSMFVRVLPYTMFNFYCDIVVLIINAADRTGFGTYKSYKYMSTYTPLVNYARNTIAQKDMCNIRGQILGCNRPVAATSTFG